MLFGGGVLNKTFPGVTNNLKHLPQELLVFAGNDLTTEISFRWSDENESVNPWRCSAVYFTDTRQQNGSVPGADAYLVMQEAVMMLRAQKSVAGPRMLQFPGGRGEGNPYCVGGTFTVNVGRDQVAFFVRRGEQGKYYFLLAKIQ